MRAFGVGRFVADPVLHNVNDTQVCKFTLVLNEYRKVNGERKKFPHFFDFEVWAQAAELIAQYCKKGDLLEVYASARQQKWNDKATGEPRSKVIFRVDDFTFLPRGKAAVSEDASEPEGEEEQAF